MPNTVKTHDRRAVPTVTPDTIALLRRLKLQGGGSEYLFISRDRLIVLGRKLDDGTLRAGYEPINNMLRKFKDIQREARALLAKRRGVALDKVDWPVGTIHDMRRTYITEMAEHTDIITLTRWVGHKDPKTTMQYYHRTKSSAAERAKRVAASGRSWAASAAARRGRSISGVRSRARAESAPAAPSTETRKSTDASDRP